jgi:tRNA A37 threonylcarbamoyladenosine dehydratase
MRCIGMSTSRHAEFMVEGILAINTKCQVTYADNFITSDNVAKLLDHNFSYVDAIDSLRPKVALLSSYCRHYQILVVNHWCCRQANCPDQDKIAQTKIEVVDLVKIIQDQLATNLRMRLKHDFNVVKMVNVSLVLTAYSLANPWSLYP